MAVPIFELVALVGGVAYGYFKKGREDKGRLFRKGLMWGVILAAVLALVAAFGEIGLAAAGQGFILLALEALILVALFVLGVLIGDWLEHRRAPATPPP